MEHVRVLVAPLNWGLGHATRCVPIVERLLAEGNDVVLAGNGDSLAVLRQKFPKLNLLRLPDFEMTYSKGKSQVLAMIRALPSVICSSFADHRALKRLLKTEHFDMVVSDNRFGFFSKHTHSVYITHQLQIRMPRGLRWMEGFVHWLHLRVIKHYDECWIPDFDPGKKGWNLSGELTCRYPLPKNARFIGPLSRFEGIEADADASFDIVVVLSGPEPHRTFFEQQILEKYSNGMQKVLVVRGKPSLPPTRTVHNNITLLPHLDDLQLSSYLKGCKKIITRSGYSTIMDLYSLGVLEKADFTATPGQTEQEYLALLHANVKNDFAIREN